MMKMKEIQVSASKAGAPHLPPARKGNVPPPPPPGQKVKKSSLYVKHKQYYNKQLFI